MTRAKLGRRVLALEQQLPESPPDLRLLRELDQAGRDRLRRILADVLAGNQDLRPQLVQRAVAHGEAGLSPGAAFARALEELGDLAGTTGAMGGGNATT
jgi:hypothetical protein